MVGKHHVHVPLPDHRAHAVGAHHHRGRLVDPDAGGRGGPAVGVDPGEEPEQPPHAIAVAEVSVGDDALEHGQRQEALLHRHVEVVRVLERFVRVHRFVVRRVHELPQHGQARAGAPDHRAAIPRLADPLLHAGAHPALEVAGLVAAYFSSPRTIAW